MLDVAFYVLVLLIMEFSYLSFRKKTVLTERIYWVVKAGIAAVTSVLLFFLFEKNILSVNAMISDFHLLAGDNLGTFYFGDLPLSPMIYDNLASWVFLIIFIAAILFVIIGLLRNYLKRKHA